MESQHQQMFLTTPQSQQQQQQQQQKYFNNYNNNTRSNNKYYNNANNNNSSLKYQYHQQQQHYQYNNNNMVDINNNSSHYLNDSSALRDKLTKLNISTNNDPFMKNNRLTPTSPNSSVNTPLSPLQSLTNQQSLQSPSSPLSPTIIKNDSNSQPVWKSFIYDPNTSIYLIKRDRIDKRFLTNKQYLNDIALKTKTKISFHSNGDLNENNTTVYFTVTGVYEARCNALEMLRDETGKAGVIVNLPSLLNDEDANRRQLKSSLTRNPSTVKKHCSFAIDDLNSDNRMKKLNMDTNQYSNNTTSNNNNSQFNQNNKFGAFKRTKSFHNKFEITQDQTNNDFEHGLNRTNSQSSSITSTSSASSSGSTSINIRRKYSHGSSLMPASNDINSPGETTTSKQQQQQQQNSSGKKRYTLDFLLQRADDTQSKQIPKDWPELNLKYPNICFCGRVISYFNPYKYQAYWIKIKQSNQHLHA